MANLEQIDKKLNYSEKDRQELKRQIRHNKNEKLDNCFSLARATEEKLQQMSGKREATDKEPEKHIKKDMEEMKKRYYTVNEKLWNLDTRMDTMGKKKALKFLCHTVQTGCSLEKLISPKKISGDPPRSAIKTL